MESERQQQEVRVQDGDPQSGAGEPPVPREPTAEPTPAPARQPVLVGARPKLPTPRVALALVLLNVAAFVLSIRHGVGLFDPSPDDLVAVGGNLPALTLNGEPWRLVTSMFLHSGGLHLFMNMACLMAAGQSVEFLLGRRSFLAIYLSAGLVGSICSAARTAMVVSVGASAAVFGVFGAHLAYLLAHRDELDPAVRATQVRSLGTFMGFNLVVGFLGAGIDMAAHVGGLVAGFLIAFVAERRLDLSSPDRAHAVRLKRVVLGTVLAVAVVVVGLVALPGPGLVYMTAAEARSVEQLDRKIQQFVATEPGLIERYNALLQDNDASAEAAGKVIDDELLPGWRALAANLGDAPGLPSAILPRYRALMDYIGARIAHLEALSVMVKLDPSSAEFADARADANRKDEVAAAALSALQRAMQP